MTSVFRHCQRFWGASGDFWQAQWDKFLDTVGEDPFYLWVYGTFVLSFGVYWLFGGIYTIMDMTNKPAAIRRYKIQPGTNEPVDNRKLLKVIILQIKYGFNGLYISLVLTCLCLSFNDFFQTGYMVRIDKSSRGRNSFVHVNVLGDEMERIPGITRTSNFSLGVV